jgi:pyruvate kinase
VEPSGFQPKLVRKTKIVATIGPATATKEEFNDLLDSGVNVARLNMSHGDHDSHGAVVDLVRQYNKENNAAIAIMLDTKGPEVRSGDLADPMDLHPGDPFTFTITQKGVKSRKNTCTVNYDDFVNDVHVGDLLLVDGGMMSLEVVNVTSKDVDCKVVDGGVLKSRRHLNVRGKSASLPSITDKDWEDIDFGVRVGVDYYALSFVKDEHVVHELRAYLKKKKADIKILVKIESADSIKNLEAILETTDGAMVARGDLGAELPVEEVPMLQQRIVQICRKLGKPVIVATNMLESMIDYPTPTRAEVSDISIAVREGADAVMLSGESAYGQFPYKSVQVMSTVSERTEKALELYAGIRRYGSEVSDPITWIQEPGNQLQSSDGQEFLTSPHMSEVLAYHATTMSNTIKCPLIVFTRHGNMPRLISHYRPKNMIFAFTENYAVQRNLNLYNGVCPLHLNFSNDKEETFQRALTLLKNEGYVAPGQVVTIIQSGKRPIWRATGCHTIQVIMVE